jgi:hypothetical protein
MRKIFVAVSICDRAVASMCADASFVFVLTLSNFGKIVGDTQRQKK